MGKKINVSDERGSSSLKIPNVSMRTLLELRGEMEKERGRIIPIADVLREIIEIIEKDAEVQEQIVREVIINEDVRPSNPDEMSTRGTNIKVSPEAIQLLLKMRGIIESRRNRVTTLTQILKVIIRIAGSEGKIKSDLCHVARNKRYE